MINVFLCNLNPMCGYTGYSQPVLSSSKKKTGDEVALNVKISEAQHQFFFDIHASGTRHQTCEGSFIQ